MKYKRLTNEELEAFKPEFIHFLSAAQITGQDWEQMKKEEIAKAEELIEIFSDMVYDKILKKIKYLEYREKKTLNIYHCTSSAILLVGLRVHEQSDIDLTASDILEKWNNNHAASVSVIKSERAYQKERETEVFELIQNGCYITNEHLFNTLYSIIEKK